MRFIIMLSGTMSLARALISIAFGLVSKVSNWESGEIAQLLKGLSALQTKVWFHAPTW